MRGAGKLKFWTGGYINRPGVTPPLFLRLIMFGLLLMSIATIVFGVFGIMGHFSLGESAPAGVIMAVAVFFLAPFVVVYALVTNHPSSRAVLVALFAAIFTYLLNVRFNGSSVISDAGLIVATAFLVGAVFWMYLSPRSRVYFALIQGCDIPDDLLHVADSLIAPTKTERLARRIWDLLEPFSPLFLIALAIVLVYAGFSNLSP